MGQEIYSFQRSVGERRA